MNFCCTRPPGYATLSGRAPRPVQKASQETLIELSGCFQVAWGRQQFPGDRTPMESYREQQSQHSERAVNVPAFTLAPWHPAGRYSRTFQWPTWNVLSSKPFRPARSQDPTQIVLLCEASPSPWAWRWPPVPWGTLLWPLISHFQTGPDICYTHSISSLWAHREQTLSL